MSQIEVLVYEFKYKPNTYLQEQEGQLDHEWYRIFWQATDETYKVLKAVQPGIVTFGDFQEITSGDDLEEIKIYAEIDKNVTVAQGGDIVRVFSRINTFPYVISELKNAVDEDAVDDLEGFFTITPASEGLPDGSIYPDATGTNTPISARIGTGSYLPLFLIQGDNTIPGWTGLFTGNYTVQLRDSKNFVRTYNLFLPTEKNDASYASIYHIDYNGYRLEVHKKGFVGSSSALTDLGPEAVLINYSSNNDLYNSRIIASSVFFQIKESPLGEFEEFENASEEEYKVLFYKQDTPNELLWQGFITPELIESQIYTGPVFINVSATDRLSNDLDELEIDLDQFSGNPSMMGLLHQCLQSTNLNQGYRIANTLYEENQTQENETTPFHHTYLEKAGLQGRTLGTVLSDILTIFNAEVRSWKGYYYIERREDKIGGTVEYKEFDKDLTYVQKFTYTNRLSFKADSEANHWRWNGLINKLREPQYKEVRLKFETSDVVNFLPVVNSNNYTIKYETDTRLGGVVVHEGSITENETVDFKVGAWNSYQYLHRAGEIEHTATDQFKISFDLTTLWGLQTRTVNYNGAYYPVKMQLKIGDFYFDQFGEWSSTPIINQKFLTTLGDNKVEFKGPLYGNSNGTATSYELKIWAVSVCETDLQASSEANMVTAIRALETTNIDYGARITTRDELETLFQNDNTLNLYYYELIRTTDADNGLGTLQPDDFNASTNNKKWSLVKSQSLFVPNVDTAGQAGTISEVSNLNMEILPEGQSAQRDYTETLKAPGTLSNRRTLEVPIYHYDPLNFSNFRYFFKNTISMAAGAKPGKWGGKSLKIQEYLHRELLRLYKNSRQRTSAPVKSDILIEPIQVLYAADLQNIEYLPITMRLNTKGQVHEVDMVEYFSDTASSIFDFNQTDFLPEDFI